MLIEDCEFLEIRHHVFGSGICVPYAYCHREDGLCRNIRSCEIKNGKI